MVLVKLSGGPLGGEEKTINDPDAMGTELPGYSPVEQVMDPERGQILRAEWGGDPAAESYYPNSEQAREREGNETGVRSDDKLTGAQRRDAKNKDKSASTSNM